jgi:hypothetical protein
MPKFTASIPPASPTPNTPPTAAWVVETGSPNFEASKTVEAAAKSTEKTPGVGQGGNFGADGIHYPMTGHADAGCNADAPKQKQK